MVRLMAEVLYELLNLPVQTTIIIRACQTAAMMQAMRMHGFRIHEQQRQVKSEVALFIDVNALLNIQLADV